MNWNARQKENTCQIIYKKITFLLILQISEFKMKKQILLVAMAVVLAGCATAPVDSGRAKEVPPDRILAYGAPNPDYAKVEIVRDAGFLGSGCYLGVMYRQTVLARFAPSEKAVFYLPEGEWPMAVTKDPDGRMLCGMNEAPAVERQKIVKGRENLFRISSGPYRRPRLLPQ